MLTTLSLLGLTALTTTNQAFAWGYRGSPCCDQTLGSPCCDNQGQGGYNAGLADAVYDHNNNLQYNPVGNCLSCHSQDYWNNFKQGYDTQWKTYQSSQQTVNNYVTVNGDGNDVNINNRQNSDQLSHQGLDFQQPQTEGCCGWNNWPGPEVSGDP